MKRKKILVNETFLIDTPLLDFLISNRKSGSTTAIVSAYNQRRGYILCGNEHHKHFINTQFEIPKQDLITVNDISRGKLRGRSKKPIYVDTSFLFSIIQPNTTRLES